MYVCMYVCICQSSSKRNRNGWKASNIVDVHPRQGVLLHFRPIDRPGVGGSLFLCEHRGMTPEAKRLHDSSIVCRNSIPMTLESEWQEMLSHQPENQQKLYSRLQMYSRKERLDYFSLGLNWDSILQLRVAFTKRMQLQQSYLVE